MALVELRGAPLRDWLRAETRERHDLIDADFSRLSASGRHGRARFLTAQALAAPGLAALVHARNNLPASFASSDFDPAPAASLLTADLGELGYTAPPPLPVSGFGRMEAAIGAAYTLAGSRLGAKVLDREWRADESYPFASRYLSADKLFGDWRRFCSALADLTPEQVDFEAIREGALAAFDHFGDAARAAFESMPVDE